jgi:hypothetical protein
VLTDLRLDGSPRVSDTVLALVLIRGVLLFEFGARQPESSKPTEIYRIVVHLLHSAWARMHPVDVKDKQSHLRIFWPKKNKSHPSTVFVFNELRMVDPTVTPARARTAIQNVIEHPAKFERVEHFIAKFEGDALHKLPKALDKLIEGGMRRRLTGGATADKSKRQRF